MVMVMRCVQPSVNSIVASTSMPVYLPFANVSLASISNEKYQVIDLLSCSSTNFG